MKLPNFSKDNVFILFSLSVLFITVGALWQFGIIGKSKNSSTTATTPSTSASLQDSNQTTDQKATKTSNSSQPTSNPTSTTSKASTGSGGSQTPAT